MYSIMMMLCGSTNSYIIYGDCVHTLFTIFVISNKIYAYINGILKEHIFSHLHLTQFKVCVMSYI